MIIFEEGIFREMLETVRVSPINYDIMDMKAFWRINISERVKNKRKITSESRSAKLLFRLQSSYGVGCPAATT
jgi:hypothetical protein